MRADADLLRQEARDQIKQALLNYATNHDPEHVLLYAAARLHVWNELQARAETHAADLARAIEAVDDALLEHMRNYLR